MSELECSSRAKLSNPFLFVLAIGEDSISVGLVLDEWAWIAASVFPGQRSCKFHKWWLLLENHNPTSSLIFSSFKGSAVFWTVWENHCSTSLNDIFFPVAFVLVALNIQSNYRKLGKQLTDEETHLPFPCRFMPFSPVLIKYLRNIFGK